MTNRCTTAQSTKVVRRWAPPAIVTLAATAALMALTAAPPADAGPPRAPLEHTTEAAAPRNAAEPIMAIVSIKSQKVTIYDADGWVLRAPVSSGTAGRETPAGVFSVVEKDKDHRSSLYDDAWMPNMLRITWNGLALHGGPLPGYAASHGCVRMPYGFAEKLFDKVRIGTRVIISPSDAEPVEFSHPALFVPKSEAIAAAPTRSETLAREADEATKLAQQTKNAAALAVKERPRSRQRCASWPRLAPMPRSRSQRRRSPPPRPTRPRHEPRTRSGRPLRKSRNCRRSSTPPRPTRSPSSTLPRRPRAPPRRQRPRRPTRPRPQARQSWRSSRSQSSSAARRRSFTCGATRI